MILFAQLIFIILPKIFILNMPNKVVFDYF